MTSHFSTLLKQHKEEIEPDNYRQIKLPELMYMDIDNLFLGFVALFLKLKHVTYSALQSSLPV